MPDEWGHESIFLYNRREFPTARHFFSTIALFTNAPSPTFMLTLNDSM